MILLAIGGALAAPWLVVAPEGVEGVAGTGLIVVSGEETPVFIVAPAWDGPPTDVAVLMPVEADGEAWAPSGADGALEVLIDATAPAGLDVDCTDLYPFVDRRDTGGGRGGDVVDEHPRLRHSTRGPLSCGGGGTTVTPIYEGPYGYGYYGYGGDVPYYSPGYGKMADGSRIDVVDGPPRRASAIREIERLADAEALAAWLRERGLRVPRALGTGAWMAVAYEVTGADPGRLDAFAIRTGSDTLRVDVEGDTDAEGATDVIYYALGPDSSPSSPRPRVPDNVDAVDLESNCLYDDADVLAVYEAALAAAVGPAGGRRVFVREYVGAVGQCVGCDGIPDLGGRLPSLEWQGDPFTTSVTRGRLVVDDDADEAPVGFGPGEAGATYTAYVRHTDELESDFPLCGGGFAEDPGSCLDAPVARRPAPGRAGAVVGLGLLAVGLLVAARRR